MHVYFDGSAACMTAEDDRRVTLHDDCALGCKEPRCFAACDAKHPLP